MFVTCETYPQMKKLKPSLLQCQETPMRDETRSVSWAFRSPPVPVERLVRTSGLSHGPVLCKLVKKNRPYDPGCKKYNWMWLNVIRYSRDSWNLPTLLILCYNINQNWMQSASLGIRYLGVSLRLAWVCIVHDVAVLSCSLIVASVMFRSVQGTWTHACMFKECVC